jgi:ATP-binding protein involved in chromosome partitioning
MVSSALRQFFTECIWGDLDYLILDLPPGTGDVHLTLAQQIPITGAVVVTTPQKVAMADARKGISMFKMEGMNIPIIGVVENMSWFTPAELPDSKYYLFGKGGGAALAEEFDVPLLGQIPLVQSIREGGDQGNPAVLQNDAATTEAFMNFATTMERQVAIINSKSNQPAEAPTA